MLMKNSVSFVAKVLKVAILAEKYATDYTWYVDVILNLIRIAGDYVSDEVWFRVIQIVINRDDVQGYAAKTVFEVSPTFSVLSRIKTYLIVFFVNKKSINRLCRLQHVTKIWSKLDRTSWENSVT